MGCDSSRSTLGGSDGFGVTIRLTFLTLLVLFSGCSSQQTKTQYNDDAGTAMSQGYEKRTVYYAGFAYLGKDSLIEQNYPHALRLNSEKKNNVGRLEQAMKNVLANRQPNHLELSLDYGDTRKTSESIVFSLAIDNEYTSIENLTGGEEKIIAEVSAQLLFFDFGSKTLVANLPISYAKNAVHKKGSDRNAVIRNLYDEIYLGLNDSLGLFRYAAGQLQDLDLGQYIEEVRVQVTDVAVDEQAAKEFPQDQGLDSYKQYLGQYMSATLSKGYRLSVLPFVQGYAIGNKMPARFANSDETLNITIPKPDYSFGFTLTRLKSQPINDSYFYAAYGKLKFEDKSFGEVYINDDFKQAVQKLVVTTEGLDHWGAYNDAVEELISGLVIQLGEPDDDWFDKHARTASTSYDNFEKKQELFSGVIRQ